MPIRHGAVARWLSAEGDIAAEVDEGTGVHRAGERSIASTARVAE